jgi:hypothetical protein
MDVLYLGENIDRRLGENLKIFLLIYCLILRQMEFAYCVLKVHDRPT